jgi:hypothetical protein
MLHGLYATTVLYHGHFCPLYYYTTIHSARKSQCQICLKGSQTKQHANQDQISFLAKAFPIASKPVSA